MKMCTRRCGPAALAVVAGITVGVVAGTTLAWRQDDRTQADDAARNRARGEAALAEARQHVADHRWRLAIQAYESALTYMPGDMEALDGLRTARAELNQAPTISSVDQELRVQLGRAREEFSAAYQRASRLLDQGDFNGAQREMLTGQIRLRQARGLFNLQEFNDFNQQAERLLVDIERRSENDRLEPERRADREAARQRRDSLADAKQQRNRLIDENLRRVHQLQMELKYDEALQVIDEILFIDEHNPAALVLRDVIKTTMLYRRFSELQRQKEFGIGWLTIPSQESLIPPQPNISGPGSRSLSGVMEYPSDWAQLSLRRTHEAGFAESVANRQVARVLNHTTVPIDFKDNTFEQVTNFLSRVSGENVYVDWRALDFIGVSPDDRVTLRLNDVSVAIALDRVLEQVGDDLDRPQWAVQDGMVTISSEQALRKHTGTDVYDIRDLLFKVPYFGNAPELDLGSALIKAGQAILGSAGGFGGGGGGGARGGGAIFSDPADQSPRLSREELVDQIVGIIQENIDPDGWRELGGDTGTLQELNGNLIITQTVRSHRQIEGLLSQLREIRALQINVESRFLKVTTDWYEQIGVDLDLYFNTNSALRNQQLLVDNLSHLSDLFDPTTGQLIDPFRFGQIFDPITGNLIADRVPFGSIFGVPDPDGAAGLGFPDIQDTVYSVGAVGAPLRATQGFTPIGVIQDSLGLLNSVAGLTGFGEAVAMANPALTVAVQFLDDIQVDLLIEATQADRRSVVLTAPRLTFFNGQRAWVAVATQVAFISALIPITGDAAGAFQPIPGVVSEGAVLDVEGVISADRRYVTMTTIVSLSEIINIREIEVQGAVGGIGQVAGVSNTFSATQELPEVQVSLVQTTVSVPDKGTVMLGGLREVTEIEVETGVPVLSKIPFISRFFTNRLTSKNETTLLILIRPEIIIQQENEDLLFPGLSDTLGGVASYLR